jgi:hypothetical protein
MIGNNDLGITAYTVSAGLTLVTNNGTEFRQVAGLKIQNWPVSQGSKPSRLRWVHPTPACKDSGFPTASDQFTDFGRYLSNSDNELLHFTAIAKPVPD